MQELNHIGLGMAAIGRPHYINIRQENPDTFSLSTFKQKGLALLDLAYKLGVRYFDTAPGYGIAEPLLIKWLENNKEKFPSIATKWGYTYVANFNPDAKTHEKKEHSIEKLNEQWESSKTLLPKLNYYQIHSATHESNVLNNDRVLDRLADLKETHDIVIGLTTTGAQQVDVFKKALEIERNGEPLFDLFQMTYNVFDQSISSTVQQLIRDQDIKIVIKEALANGRVFPNENFPRYDKTYTILSDLSDKYNVGIDAIALRFCIDSLPIFKVLSGAATEKHLRSNIKAESFKLDKDDIQMLKSLAVDSQRYWNERKTLAWN